MNAPHPRSPLSCAAIGDDPLVLTQIFEPDVQLAQWQRPSNSAIADWLETSLGNLGSGSRQYISPGALPDLSQFPPGPGRDALAQDLQLLAEMLGELLDAKQIGIRLEVVRNAMCPRLHVDNVGMRLLCTYRGPGTEWVEEHSVDRRFLGHRSGGLPDATSGLLAPNHQIESIPPFAVGLLKGALWQGNSGRGMVHRSPMVENPPRVLVALDAAW